MAKQILIYGIIALLQFTAYAIEEDTITITAVNYQGDGCPKGTVLADLSPDKEAFTTTFSQFSVIKNGSKDPFGQKKECHLTLKIKKPKDLGFQLFSLNIEGAADLEDKLEATQKIYVNTFGQPYRSPKRIMRLNGPYADSYEQTEEFDFIKKPLIDCGRKTSRLTIKTHISIEPIPQRKNDKFGFMTVNLSEGLVKEKLDIIWIHCNKNKRKKKYFSFCRINIHNKKSNKITKTKISRGQAISENDSLQIALNKANNICQKNQNKPNHSCDMKKIKCKSQKLF